MDGGGEDVYEKNEIVSVVTTKKGGRDISYHNRFVCTQTCNIEANTWAQCEPQAHPDKRKTSTVLQCVSCTEVDVLSKFYVFPLATLFSFHCWISDTRSGEGLLETEGYERTAAKNGCSGN